MQPRVTCGVLIGILIFSLTGCGVGTPANPRDGAAAQVSVAEHAIPVTGGTATSPDGIFSVVVSPHTFSETIEVAIAETAASPLPDQTLTKLYTATYTPTAAQLIPGSRMRAQFNLELAGLALAQADAWQIGRIDDGAEAYSRYVAPTLDTESSRLWIPVVSLGGFSIVNLSGPDQDAGGDDTTTDGPNDEPAEDDGTDDGVTEACGPDEFECASGSCVDLEQVCNGLPDCMDGSDERDCPGTQPGCDDTTVDPITGDPDDDASGGTPSDGGESSCETEPPGDEVSCFPGRTLACGEVIEGNTALAPPSNITLYSCSTWWQSGPEIAYTFVPTVSQRATVTLRPLTGVTNLDLFILEDGGSGCHADHCLDFDDFEVSWDATGGATYYVVVDGFSMASGLFELTVTCGDD